jgi:tRNA (uracil-5-)-methyltransferase
MDDSDVRDSDAMHTETVVESSPDLSRACSDSQACAPAAPATSDQGSGYAARGVYTTEIYKIRIGNLPAHFGFRQLRDLLTKRLSLNVAKLKAQPGANWAFATFRSEEETQAAISTINGFEWKKRCLTAKEAKAVEQPVMKTRTRQAESPRRKKFKQDEVSLEEQLNDQVTPLWRVSYDEQLKMKWQDSAEILKKLGKDLEKVNAGEWVRQQRRENGGLCCLLEGVRPSPVKSHYRNKCEFNAGPGPDGQPTVGFRLGKYKDGYNLVVEPVSCVHTPSIANSIASTFQEYIRQSEFEPYNTLNHTGYWKMLTVRITSTGDVMAIVHFHPQQLTAPQITDEMSKLKDTFQSKHPTITSLMFQCDTSVNIGVSESSYKQLIGQPYIRESLLGLTFQISPDAFFQVNIQAAEVLYVLIKDWVGVDLSTHVVDICCGTGTIGLSMAADAYKITGIEMVEQAVQDAQINAKLNGISNAQFLCGKAEETLSWLVSNLDCERGKVVGVVDPPRAGLHTKVMHAIRRCQKLQTLVYVSCNPSAAYRNMIE